MKNLNFLSSRSGMGPDGTSRKGRYCLDPILSRLSVASLICVLMLTIGVGNAWGETATLTITRDDFSGSGGYAWYSWTDGDFSGQAYIYATTTTSMQFNGGKSGRTIFNSTPLPGRIVSIKMTKASGTDRAWVVRGGTTANGAPTTSSTNTYGTAIGGSQSVGTKTWSTTDGTDYRYFLLYENVTSASYISEIVITYEIASDPKYTLKVSNGLGGYTTYSNKVKSDLTEATAIGGNDCASGLQGYYSGWRVGALETPAGSPGTTYNHATAGDMPASGSTLYAVYYSSGEGGYLTNTLCEETCSNTVTPAAGTKTNVTTIAFNKASVETCSETASDRQVTVTITPASCYAVPSSTRLTVTGTSASYVSGPADNGNGTYSFVYQFAQNATSTSTFAASLGTKTTYTVSYAAGSVPSGGGSITGSHGNDTKTCGTAMTLPAASFTTTGYTQTGWSKTNGGSQYAAVGGSYTDNAAQTFYPVWTANKYTVTWSVNGSTYQTTSNVSYNTTTSTPVNPTPSGDCAGLVFRGWTATANYEHATNPPGDMFNTTTPAITGNITFHAVFAEED